MTEERFSLANKRHLSAMIGILVLSGAMCPKCGHGTRRTSKRWAKCKQCGERVARQSIEDAGAQLSERGAPNA